MKIGLTPRQEELLEIIYNYVNSCGYPPSFQEMKEELGVSSNQSVHDLLTHLERKGVIKKNESLARGIAILSRGYEELQKTRLVPLAGTTSAGSPMETIEIKGEWQPLSPDVARLKNNVFLLKINGDSMINAGINDGDYVLVKEQKEFISGDIVLARMGDSTTVKRFITEDKPPYIYLKPENPKYNIIPFDDDTEMIGKIISVLNNKNNFYNH